MTGKVKPNEGDWICQGKVSGGVCGNVNFSHRTKCNKCNVEKQDQWVYKKAGIEIGKQQADKSGGLFSADDWICKSCGNINWARRNKCNICNTSKLAKSESRTGLGGGYKDRDDIVEYRERVESDDEFDEFGLKKKQYRHQTDDKRSSPDSDNNEASGQRSHEEKSDLKDSDKASFDNNNDDDEEEDEDDDGDDDDDDDDDEGDLGKYNLFDEDDEDIELADQKERSGASSGSDSGSSDSSSSSGSDSSSDEDSSGSSSSSSSASSRGRHSNEPDRRRQRSSRHGSKRRSRSRSRSPIDSRKESHHRR